MSSHALSVNGIALLVLLIAPLPASGEDEVSEQSCAVIGAGANGATKTSKLDSLHVLEVTSSAPAFALPHDAPEATQAIICGRSSIVPAANDYKVLLAGFPFNIVNNVRVGVSELSSGQVRFRMVKGALTSEE